jgi:hypothetical protein
MKVHHKRKHGESLALEPKTSVCDNCGEEFTHTPYRDRRFCSKSCSSPEEGSEWAESISDSMNPSEIADRMKGSDNPLFGVTGKDHPCSQPSGGSPIETGYGITVRSSWEKELVDFFERRGISYEYEPFEVEYEDGFYTPDFLVGDKIVEVKGHSSEKDIKKARRMVESDYEYVVIGSSRADMPADLFVEWPGYEVVEW